MENEELPKEESQNSEASRKSEDSAISEDIVLKPLPCKMCMAIKKFLAEYWFWFKKHMYEVASGFIVAIVAVFIASQLTLILEHNAQDKITEQKLQIAYLESLNNGSDAMEILKTFSDANNLGISLNRPNSSAALAAFQDANVLEFLPFKNITLLETYVKSIDILNRSLQLHQEILVTQNYDKSPQREEARQNVHENAANVFAMCVVLREELKVYYDMIPPDREDKKKREDRIKCFTRRALKGEVTLLKEQWDTENSQDSDF